MARSKARRRRIESASAPRAALDVRLRGDHEARGDVRVGGPLEGPAEEAGCPSARACRSRCCSTAASRAKPTTANSSSFRWIVEVSCRWRRVGPTSSTSPASEGASADTSTSSSRRTPPASPTLGFTRTRMPTSWRSTFLLVWNGLVVARSRRLRDGNRDVVARKDLLLLAGEHAQVRAHQGLRADAGVVRRDHAALSRNDQRSGIAHRIDEREHERRAREAGRIGRPVAAAGLEQPAAARIHEHARDPVVGGLGRRERDEGVEAEIERGVVDHLEHDHLDVDRRRRAVELVDHVLRGCRASRDRRSGRASGWGRARRRRTRGPRATRPRPRAARRSAARRPGAAAGTGDLPAARSPEQLGQRLGVRVAQRRCTLDLAAALHRPIDLREEARAPRPSASGGARSTSAPVRSSGHASTPGRAAPRLPSAASRSSAASSAERWRSLRTTSRLIRGLIDRGDQREQLAQPRFAAGEDQRVAGRVRDRERRGAEPGLERRRDALGAWRRAGAPASPSAPRCFAPGAAGLQGAPATPSPSGRILRAPVGVGSAAKPFMQQHRVEELERLARRDELGRGERHACPAGESSKRKRWPVARATFSTTSARLAFVNFIAMPSSTGAAAGARARSRASRRGA